MPIARGPLSLLQHALRAKGPTASLKTLRFQDVASSAVVYDSHPIVDHFRQIDESRIMGAMAIEGDERLYFFELERMDDS